MGLQGLSFDQFPLGQIGPDEERKLAALALNKFEGMRSFWAPSVADGEKLIKAIEGSYFDDSMKAEMRAQHKVPIEIAEGWPKFSAMVGVSILSMKSGGFLPQGPEDAITAEHAQVISKTIDNQVDLRQKRADCVRDAYATGCPQFIVFDRPTRNLGGKIMEAYRPHWKAAFLDPLCRDTSTLSDCRELGFQHLFSREELIRRYPTRKKQIDSAFSGVGRLEDATGQGLTSEERATYFAAVRAGETEVQTLGRIHVVEIFSMLPTLGTVWVNAQTGDIVSLAHLQEEELARWNQENPGYSQVQAEVDMLWVTAVTMNGQVLENRHHWMQTGRFPVAVLALQWHNEKPISPLKFAVQNWKLQAIAHTERIHSIRLSSDGLTVMRDGAIKNEEDIHYELTRPGGRVVVKRGIPLGEAFFRVPNQREQTAWADLFAEAQLTNDRLTVDRNIEGGAQSSQEAAKVVQLRVSQMQNKSAMAQMAINAFARQCESVKLDMLPLLVTEEREFRYLDESNGRGEVKSITANQVTQRDPMGEPLVIANRLDVAKFDVVETETDDSPTGREAELTSFVAIMQNVLPNVPPEFWSTVLAKIPNSITQKIASDLKEREEAQASQPQKPPTKVTANIDASKLAFDPIAQAVAKFAGVLPEDAQVQTPPSTPPAGAPPAPAEAAPTPQGATA